MIEPHGKHEKTASTGRSCCSSCARTVVVIWCTVGYLCRNAVAAMSGAVAYPAGAMVLLCASRRRCARFDLERLVHLDRADLRDLAHVVPAGGHRTASGKPLRTTCQSRGQVRDFGSPAKLTHRRRSTIIIFSASDFSSVCRNLPACAVQRAADGADHSTLE